MIRGLLCGLILVPGLALATIGFDITPPSIIAPPGGFSDSNCQNPAVMCVIFSGSITADPSVDTFVTAVQVTFNTAPATLVYNPLYFATINGFYGAGDPIYTGGIFEIDVDPTVASGTYLGTATLLGGNSSPFDLNPLATANFTLIVTPEPAAAGLAGLGLAVLALSRRARSFPRL